jgi:hypothetical protein
MDGRRGKQHILQQGKAVNHALPASRSVVTINFKFRAWVRVGLGWVLQPAGRQTHTGPHACMLAAHGPCWVVILSTIICNYI